MEQYCGRGEGWRGVHFDDEEVAGVHVEEGVDAGVAFEPQFFGDEFDRALGLFERPWFHDVTRRGRDVDARAALKFFFHA